MSSSKRSKESRKDIVRFLVVVLIGILTVLATSTYPSSSAQFLGITLDLRLVLILAVSVAVAYFVILYVRIEAERGGLSVLGGGRVDIKIQTRDAGSVRNALYEVSKGLTSQDETLKQGESYVLGTSIDDRFPYEVSLALHFYKSRPDSKLPTKSAYCSVTFVDWSLSFRCGRGHAAAFKRLEDAVKSRFSTDLMLGAVLLEKRPS